jgi:superfamily II DNA or RNA helicase
MQIPEQGQLVQVRHRFFLVEDVAQHTDERSAMHLVALECLDDDALGNRLDVVWERELNPEVLDTSFLPAPGAWDPSDRFSAFLHAIRWSTISLVEGASLQSAFRGAIELDEYQLVPVIRALRMNRVSLLLADDVGLGKTIEAALVMLELMARQRVRRVMVVCPASLQRQWQEEMATKFHLRFDILDANAIQLLRREFGVHVNPWNSFPRLITSMDFLKQQNHLQTFRSSLSRRKAGSVLRDWDLLIVDEVHNCTPAGRTGARDSDRSRMLRSISSHFEHKLFLTATPHNGYRESFTALLEMLDPLRFSRGQTFSQDALKLVQVRRLKDDITDSLGRRKFAQRHVKKIPVGLSPVEEQMCQDLDAYCESRLSRATRDDQFAIQFALTMLKKRFLSSPEAFWLSLQTHTKSAQAEERAPDPELTRRLSERSQEDWDDDDEKARAEEFALEQASQFFAGLTPDERSMLDRLMRSGAEVREGADTKATCLINWIQEHLQADDEWNNERLIIFTEYRDTLRYLYDMFADAGWEDHVITLTGGMPHQERERVKTAFQAAPSSGNPVRILLGTDAASEGLNLQNYCRNVIHYEIPWNPNRMEQRNGRIDRHGQKAPDVYCSHFHYENNADQRFLEVVVEKVRTQRADLGAVGDIISAQVEEAILGLRDTIEDRCEQVEQQRSDLHADSWDADDAMQTKEQLVAARGEMNLYPQTMAQLLSQALELEGRHGLEQIQDGELAGVAWDLRELPTSWADCHSHLYDEKNARLRIVFDPDVAKDRTDVALIHLGHPLMKRAIATFRRFLWKQPQAMGPTIHRCSYRVLPHAELHRPAIVVFARTVAISSSGQKIHEALLHVGGWIDGHQVIPMNTDLLDQSINADHSYPPIPTSLGDELRNLFPQHRKKLEEMLSDLEEAETGRLAEIFKQKADEEVASVRDLIDERIREIRERRKQVEKRREEAQMRLFDPDLAEEQEQSIRWYNQRLDQLETDREERPAAVREQFSLKQLRVFPIGMLYLLPDSLVAERGQQ